MICLMKMSTEKPLSKLKREKNIVNMYNEGLYRQWLHKLTPHTQQALRDAEP